MLGLPLLVRGACVKEQQLGEVCVSFCPACGDRLRWSKNQGAAFECWLGHCECGALRVLRLQHVVAETDS